MRGCEGRLRVAHERETPQHPPPKAGTLLPIAKCLDEYQRASQRSSQRQRRLLFEPAPSIGSRPTTDKIDLVGARVDFAIHLKQFI
jgi:hypothetical protein